MANSRAISLTSRMLSTRTSRPRSTPTGVGSVVNTANGEKISLNALLEVLKKITNSPDVAADYQPARTGDVKHSQADNSRAVELFDYKRLVGLEDGLSRTIDWWRSSRFAR